MINIYFLIYTNLFIYIMNNKRKNNKKNKKYFIYIEIFT